MRTKGVDHYTSWVIEECAQGNPFTIWVEPHTKMPVIYYKDAALALLRLAQAPLENIQTVNYILAGATPVATAGELANIVRARIPDAKIDFLPDAELQVILDKMLLPVDESNAIREWGWRCEYDQERIVDDFLAQLRWGD